EGRAESPTAVENLPASANLPGFASSDMRPSRQGAQLRGCRGRYGFEDWPTEPKVEPVCPQILFLTVMAALLDGSAAAWLTF
ncbi:mCG144682, partial [Mus musculus]